MKRKQANPDPLLVGVWHSLAAAKCAAGSRYVFGRGKSLDNLPLARHIRREIFLQTIKVLTTVLAKPQTNH